MSDTEVSPRAVTVRLDPDVRERLDSYCASTRRTLNNAVNFLLASGLDEGWSNEAQATVTQESTAHYRDEVAR